MKSEKNKNNDTKKIIIISSIALFIIAAILFISFALPFFAAKQKLKTDLKAFMPEALAEDAIIQISDPYNSDGGVIPTTVDVFLTDDDARAIAKEFCSATDGAKYLKKEMSIHGFWNVSVSVRSNGSISTVYLYEDGIYVTDGTTKYSFTLKNNSLYSSFYKKALDMIAEQAQSNA